MPNRQWSVRDLPASPIDADDLVGELASALNVDPVAQARVIWWALRHRDDVELSTADRMGDTVARFAARQRTLGRARLDQTGPDDAHAFVWARTRGGAAPAISTVHLRRTALRLACRVLGDLGAPMQDPTAGLSLPPRSRAELRALDDAEMSLLRICAAGRSRGRTLALATIALAEATATTGEIASLSWADVDLDQGSVHLPGAARVAARQAGLTDWGTAMLRALHDAQRPTSGDPVAYRGSAAPESQPRQAAMANRLGHLLRTAGLAAPDVRPTSIRLWAPARELAAGATIEDAARKLGHASLDITAIQLGYHWQGR